MSRRVKGAAAHPRAGRPTGASPGAAPGPRRGGREEGAARPRLSASPLLQGGLALHPSSSPKENLDRADAGAEKGTGCGGCWAGVRAAFLHHREVLACPVSGHGAETPGPVVSLTSPVIVHNASRVVK